MAVTGRPPKDDDARRNRAALVHEWLEVPDVPFRGAPALGHRPGGGAWPEATKQWWQAISTMPHAATWRAPAWEFAKVTALVHAAVVEGDQVRAQELRRREAAMGTTNDALRALRIRYVDPTEPSGPSDDDEVRRRREERRRRIVSGEVV